MKKFLSITSIIFFAISTIAQDTVRYTGSTIANSDYHHGQLSPVIGIRNIQVLRANREHPEYADDFGWTYNHGPNMVYHNGNFYVQYLSNPVGEHIPPGQVFLATSPDGYNWTKPVVLFQPYKIPDGTTKEGVDGVANDLYAVLHQRMGFYVAPNGKLLTLAYYGVCLNEKDDPNDGNGIGRAVREIYNDGTLGPIFFIRYNKNWTETNTSYPFYKLSGDGVFIEACDALLSEPLMMQQWVEEADRDDPLIPLKKQFKAFSYYHLNDGRVVGLWKYALTSISNDGGKTWEYDPVRAPQFVNKNAKIWGQKLSDGDYATVYNPSQFRWPLAISTSADGIEYTTLHLVNGEISTMRYGGQYKSYGPQYVRGILEGNGIPPDGNLWVTYSMNKEDIWVSSIPVPITAEATGHSSEIFDQIPNGHELDTWNIFSPIWAPVRIEEGNDGKKALVLSDKDPYDYAVAEKVVPVSDKLMVEFTLEAGQNDHGLLHVELQNAEGNAALRIVFDSEGNILNKDGYNIGKVGNYEPAKIYTVRIEADASRNYFEVFLNEEKKTGRMCFQKVNAFNRVMFRTGERRYYPDIESPQMQMFDVEHPGEPVNEAKYYIYSFKTLGELTSEK